MKEKEEARQFVRTIGGCKSLHQRAELSTNKRVKSLMRSGVDLIAADAWYHRCCRANLLSEIRNAILQNFAEKKIRKIATSDKCVRNFFPHPR